MPQVLPRNALMDASHKGEDVLCIDIFDTLDVKLLHFTASMQQLFIVLNVFVEELFLALMKTVLLIKDK